MTHLFRPGQPGALAEQTHQREDPMLTIAAHQRTHLPQWAILERRLIDAMNQAASIYAQKYTNPGGALIWRSDYPGDGVWADDLYEAFHNWPTFYALGGDRAILDMAIEEWNAVTRQVTYDYGRASKEFINDDDWFHNGENYIYFYAFGLADPTNAEIVRRSRRFAGLYMGEDPEAPNYDPLRRLVRSPFNGSKGPLFHARFGDVRYNLAYQHTTLGPGYAPAPNWWEDRALREEVHARFDQVVMRGDIPVNLAIVGLVTNAYLHTGETKYRDWVAQYVEAWMERIALNGGILPDNIGLSGEIGENRGGQWWGGFYGWTGTYSWHMMGSALIVAAQCAQLITRDSRYLDLLRSQIDVLLQHATVHDGRLLVPYKHTDEGWIDYRPAPGYDLVHLWTVSQARQDWERLERVRQSSDHDWNVVRDIRTKGEDGHEEPWTRFLAGANPTYPEDILTVNYRQMCNRMDLILNEKVDLTQIDVHHWQQRNPVLVEGLVQLAWGCPAAVYNGGLAQGRVFYFDPAAKRPGLPPDVAALVRQMDDHSVTLQMVNLSPAAARTVIIQSGCYGEHRFTTAAYSQGSEETPEPVELPVQSQVLTLELPPGSEIELRLGVERYVNNPRYGFPWQDMANAG